MNQDLRQLQEAFTQYLRNPSEVAAPPGLPTERIQVYRDLVFRNARSLLASNFPVIKKIVVADEWDALVRGFIRDHRAHTPHFPLLATEFLRYLEVLSEQAPETESEILKRYPFLPELAHYEWAELDAKIAATPRAAPKTGNITVEHTLVLNPTAHVLAYQWPVHEIGRDFLPSQPPELPTFLTVYQNADTRCEFVLLTPLAALLLENIQDNPNRSVLEHMGLLNAQHPDLAESILQNDVLELLAVFQSQDLVFTGNPELNGGTV